MSQNTSIAISSVHDHIIARLSGVIPKQAWGETSYFYNPGEALKRGTYFATIKEKDGDNDRGSNLNRDGIWRLNIGVQKTTYVSMFGATPQRPGKGATIEGPWDFAQSDMIMPHPVYAWMGWVAVLSPTEATWQDCIPLIADAHERAQKTFEKRTRRSTQSV